MMESIWKYEQETEEVTIRMVKIQVIEPNGFILKVEIPL